MIYQFINIFTTKRKPNRKMRSIFQFNESINSIQMEKCVAFFSLMNQSIRSKWKIWLCQIFKLNRKNRFAIFSNKIQQKKAAGFFVKKIWRSQIFFYLFENLTSSNFPFGFLFTKNFNYKFASKFIIWI